MSSNSLGTVVPQYTAILDEIIECETLTGDLNIADELVKFNGNGKVEIPKITADGLGDYDRSTGFVGGGVALSWEEKALSYDRGRKFSIDVMDDEEREMVVSMNLMSQFVRTKVIPEVDAIRFARLATAAPEGQTLSQTISTAAAAKTAILNAESAIEDTGAKLSECILYLTSTMKAYLRDALTHSWGNEQGPNTNFQTFDDMKVVVVPQSRFYTAVDTYDGTTTGETDGGYVKADSAKDIEFMIVKPECCAAIARHERLRYFAPDVNQDADAHLWQYRLYHDLLTFDNKANWIYLAKKA